MNRFVSQCLARHYEVVSAFDGREGLEKALRFRPLLVVSDIMMPNMSGVEMIAEMRKLPELRSTPILLLSAKADEQLMVKLLDEGAQDFIVKPFSEKDLLVRIRNLVLAVEAREETTLSLVREREAREEAELQKRLLHSLFMQAPTLIAVLRGPEHVIELANPPICEVLGRAEGRPQPAFFRRAAGAARTGLPFAPRRRLSHGCSVCRKGNADEAGPRRGPARDDVF